ncbi:hypothetical protein [Stenotrophomonas sp. YIM B06876]|uniref:hypothetical protein n=1 Tax=Stenotrophomonas sp. YIM B06876 TaxID=3060211 RepID=UPI002738D9CA|nr:hypothetical protein [Stenotrophomonas sp. YIM B06876]
MSTPPPQPVSLLREMVIATVVGVATGMYTGNIVVGSAVGIGLGTVLSIVKTLRSGRGGRS